MAARRSASLRQQEEGVDSSDQRRVAPIPVGPILKGVIRAAIKSRQPLALAGPTGIGKSEILRQVADELGIGYRVLDLSVMEPVDLLGLPQIVENSTGRRTTTFAPPAMLPFEGKGVLVLEEINRCDRAMRQPLLTLLTTRTIGDAYVLPEGWHIATTYNPPAEGYQVDDLDPALKARLLEIRVEASWVEFRDWARSVPLHPVVMEYLEQHARSLQNVPPRTWTYVSNCMEAAIAEEIRTPGTLRTILGGYLPFAVVRKLLKVVENRGGQRDRVSPEYVLEKLADDEALAEQLKQLRADGRTDVLENLAYACHGFLESHHCKTMIVSGRFSLPSFEKLVTFLAGDLREQLQSRVSELPLADQLGLLPDDFLRRDLQTPTLLNRVAGWSDDFFLAHRVAILTRAIAARLRTHERLFAIRKDRGALWALARLLEIVSGTDAGQELLGVLRERNLLVQDVLED